MCTFIHQFLEEKKSYYTHPPFEDVVGYYFSYYDYFITNVHHSFRRFFVFVPTPKNIYILIDLSIFRFILVYTRIIWVINQYIIIHTMKNHCFPWTSFLAIFQGLSLFLYKYNIQPCDFKLTTTYNYTELIVSPLHNILSPDNNYLKPITFSTTR